MPNDFIDDLNTINRAFLCFNDRKELEDFTKISFSNRNNAAKASFEKRYNAFERLAEDARNNCWIDLRQFLDIYDEVSNNSSTEKQSYIYGLIDAYIDGDDADDLSLKTAVKILILTGLLPHKRTRKGVVGDIRNDFVKFFTLIEDYCKATGRDDYGYMGIYREQFAEADTDILTRLMLVSNASDILLTLRRYNNPKSRYAAVNGFGTAVHDLDGIYCSFDGYNTNSFWELELDNVERKNYFLTHYYKNDDHYEHIIYQAIIIEKRGIRQLWVMSDKYSRTLCEKDSAEDEEILFWLDFYTKPTSIYPKNDKRIKKLALERVSSKGLRLDLEMLCRVENDDSFLKRKEKSVLATELKYCFFKSGRLTAVTEDSLVFDIPDDVKCELQTNQSFISVPRTGDLMCYDSINSDVCFVVFGDGKVYLAFYNLNKFLDVAGLLNGDTSN